MLRFLFLLAAVGLMLATQSGDLLAGDIWVD